MELYQLEYFRALCKFGSYTEAAVHLNVTQPAITQAIKKLEQELNLPLIERKGKHFVLTEMGQSLLLRTETILTEIENIYLEMQEYANTEREAIRLGLPLTMCKNPIDTLSEQFLPAHPNIDILPTYLSAIMLIDALERGEVDIGIIPHELATTSLQYCSLGKVEFKACFPKGHPLLQEDTITPDRLSSVQLLLSKKKGGVSQCIQTYFNTFGIELLSFTSGDLLPQTIKYLVAHNFGVAFLSAHAAEDSDRIGQPFSHTAYVYPFGHCLEKIKIFDKGPATAD